MREKKNSEFKKPEIYEEGEKIENKCFCHFFLRRLPPASANFIFYFIYLFYLQWP